jgi:hypothetical protein
MRGKRSTAAWLVAAALLAGACSSTTREGLQATAGEDATGAADADSVVLDVATEGGGEAATGSDAAGGPSAAGGAAQRRTAGAAGGAGGPGPAARAGDAPISSGQIKIGLHVSEDLQAAYAAFGAQGAEGDVRPALEKVVAWINDHGGYGGRKVVPVFHGSDALNGSFDSQAQAACSHFTEDEPVFAVVSGAVLPSVNLPECMVKKRTPLVWNYHYLVDRPLWDRYLPYLYMPFSMSADRLGVIYPDELVAAGFFGTGARVGIIRYDNPQHTRFSRELLRPRLAARGINVVEEVAVRQPPSAAAAGDTAAQLASGILRFRGQAVSHVVFVPTGGAVPFIFMSEAEGQGFRPRYAINSLDIPYFVSDQAPAGQLANAMAVGWSPASDTRRAQEPLRGPSALCYELTNSQAAQRFCDGLFFLKAALDRAPGVSDAAGLRAAVERLGTNFDPVFSLATRFGPGRHDGAAAIRIVTFDRTCECFQYTGPLKPVG